MVSNVATLALRVIQASEHNLMSVLPQDRFYPMMMWEFVVIPLLLFTIGLISLAYRKERDADMSQMSTNVQAEVPTTVRHT